MGKRVVCIGGESCVFVYWEGGKGDVLIQLLRSTRDLESTIIYMFSDSIRKDSE